MEGLLLDEELRRLEPHLGKRLGWRFPGPHTSILPLAGKALWLFNKPPTPRLEVSQDLPPVTKTHTGFQDLLVAKATGPLLGAEQLKLDRVVTFYFGLGEGFVPTPPVKLIFELTGRNCNLILTSEDGVILGAARDIGADINRFRQVRAGLTYTPPPPYEKLDPRGATANELRAALLGKRLKKLRGSVDGLGPELTRALAVIGGVSTDKPLNEVDVERMLPALKRLTSEPTRVIQEAFGLPDVRELREREIRAAKLERLTQALTKRLELTGKKLADIGKARAAAAKADQLRAEADVLMAYQFQVGEGASSAELTDFEGNPLKLNLDPKLSAVENAEAMYERAKKREQRSSQAGSRETDLQREQAELKAYLEKLETFNDKKLGELLEHFVPKKEKQFRAGPGIRYKGPHGFTVLVGRNSRDNDTLTTRVAKSRDLWLHVQGYRGSHVIVQAQNKEVPFDTVLFAAQLAAAYSKAAQSDNVPVDYTLRKNVWKVKGGAPGAVHYTQQKTVYVTPDRSPSKDV